jgi:hypothetical protein
LDLEPQEIDKLAFRGEKVKTAAVMQHAFWNARIAAWKVAVLF